MFTYVMIQLHIATEAGACRDEVNRVNVETRVYGKLSKPVLMKKLDENVLTMKNLSKMNKE